MFVLYYYLIVYLFNQKIENMEFIFYSILIMLPIILFAALFTAVVLHLEKKIDENK